MDKAILLKSNTDPESQDHIVRYMAASEGVTAAGSVLFSDRAHPEPFPPPTHAEVPKAQAHGESKEYKEIFDPSSWTELFASWQGSPPNGRRCLYQVPIHGRFKHGKVSRSKKNKWVYCIRLVQLYHPAYHNVLHLERKLLKNDPEVVGVYTLGPAFFRVATVKRDLVVPLEPKRSKADVLEAMDWESTLTKPDHSDLGYSQLKSEESLRGGVEWNLVGPMGTGPAEKYSWHGTKFWRWYDSACTAPGPPICAEFRVGGIDCADGKLLAVWRQWCFDHQPCLCYPLHESKQWRGTLFVKNLEELAGDEKSRRRWQAIIIMTWDLFMKANKTPEGYVGARQISHYHPPPPPPPVHKVTFYPTPNGGAWI